MHVIVITLAVHVLNIVNKEQEDIPLSLWLGKIVDGKNRLIKCDLV